MFKGVAFILFAYMFGSIPTGVILSRYWAKVDVTKRGSGNIGATNVYRTVGKGLGALTLLGDVIKGVIPVAVAVWLFKSQTWISLTALSAFMGHLYPVFLRFRGGKGVATAVGVCIPIVPWALLVAFPIFAGVVYKWGYVSLGSIVAAGSLPIWIALFSYSEIYIVMSVIIAGLIIYKHQDNIRRLMKGEEDRTGKGE